MLTLKSGKSFANPQTGLIYDSAFMIVAEIHYKLIEKKVHLETIYYRNRGEYENPSNGQGPIDRRWILVDPSHFDQWFGLEQLNSSSNIFELIFNYLMQLPGVYPGTLMFEDWNPDPG